MKDMSIGDNLDTQMSSVVVTLGPAQSEPWWWKEIQGDVDLCSLSHKRLIFRNKTSREVAALELPLLFIQLLPLVFQLRKKYEYMYTFECGLPTFILSFWQTVFMIRKPRHVVLQFIMREKTDRMLSRLKYMIMKWCFSSVYRVVCSASSERDYYREVFGWPEKKAIFVPYYVSSKYIDVSGDGDDGYVIAAGRVFRDFKTLISAARAGEYKTVIVAPSNSVDIPEGSRNIHLHCDIPESEYNSLVERAKIVVVPLEDRKISAGQIVLLHAMALGKPVIATRTSGTADYIVHGVNGILVEPYDVDALRNAINLLMSDAALCKNMGIAARHAVVERYLPKHYTKNIRDALALR